MKTLKLILIACLFTGASFSNTFGQSSKAISANQGWATGAYWSPVYCDGEQVDELSGGAILIHYVSRWVPYVSYKSIDQIKGEVTSSVTGELFNIKETDKYLGTLDFFTVTWRYNLTGNMGTHYHGTITMDLRTVPPSIIDISNTVCN